MATPTPPPTSPPNPDTLEWIKSAISHLATLLGGIAVAWFGWRGKKSETAVTEAGLRDDHQEEILKQLMAYVDKDHERLQVQITTDREDARTLAATVEKLREEKIAAMKAEAAKDQKALAQEEKIAALESKLLIQAQTILEVKAAGAEEVATCKADLAGQRDDITSMRQLYETMMGALKELERENRHLDAEVVRLLGLIDGMKSSAAVLPSPAPAPVTVDVVGVAPEAAEAIARAARETRTGDSAGGEGN